MTSKPDATGCYHDRVHKEPGNARPAKTVKRRAEVWYVRDPVVGLEEYNSEAEASNAAQALIQHYRDNAPECGWPSDLDCLEWGLLVPVESARVEATPAPEGSSFDEWWSVTLEEVAALDGLPEGEATPAPEGSPLDEWWIGHP